MGISKILDKKFKNSNVEYSTDMKCSKNISDCRYISKDGKTCSAEWCIFDELPKMITEEKEIKCIICGTPKTVSIYSGESNYICSKCEKVIERVFKNPKCLICGADIEAGQYLCENCAIIIKGRLSDE